MIEFEQFKLKEENSSLINEILHVTHIDNAIKIFNDNKIKANIVGDESKLNDYHIFATWFSPKLWNEYLYGNIAFVYNFNELIAKSNYHTYWVEAYKKPNTPASRILFTTKANIEQYKIIKANEIEEYNLIPYSPHKDNGPWYSSKDNKIHKFNEKDTTLEFIFDSSFDLSDCKRIDFVNHHSKYCNQVKYNISKKCLDQNLTSINARKYFFAAFISDYYPRETYGFFYTIKNDKHIPSKDLIIGITYLIYAFEKVNYSGLIVYQDTNIIFPLLQSIYRIYARRTDNFKSNSKDLASLFKSFDDFKNSSIELICDIFNFERETLINLMNNEL